MKIENGTDYSDDDTIALHYTVDDCEHDDTGDDNEDEDEEGEDNEDEDEEDDCETCQ